MSLKLQTVDADMQCAHLIDDYLSYVPKVTDGLITARGGSVGRCFSASLSPEKHCT